ncbi:MAG: 3-oxoacyl-[acyl-carrier-protein] synthase III C-terminal domain-containing protein [Pirellulaceae bacterium]
MISRQSGHSGIGISGISAYQPDWVLPNEWYDSLLSRKFVKHTGILKRPISEEDEVEMAVRAAQTLAAETGCDLDDCAAVLFVSPSFVPMSAARRLMDDDRAREEKLFRAAHRVVEQLPMSPRQVLANNAFCSGYARAMSIVLRKLQPALQLGPDEFILVLTSTRISRITDFGCQQTGGLFGDMATATLVARGDSKKYPVHFELIDSKFGKVATQRPFFDFESRTEVLVPTPGGGRELESERVVFSMDGMGIADTAPRAMAQAAVDIATANNLQPGEVNFIVPHQAGAAIVRLAGMKLEQAGFIAEVINGMTEEVGNVSSSSVPFALKHQWDRLRGNILCPVAAVGSPGKSEVSCGCILLRSTSLHAQLVR